MQDQLKTRNRAPCETCRTSKRKCDRSRSRCSRCRKRNLDCVPSTTAEWRVRSVNSTGHGVRQGYAQAPVMAADACCARQGLGIQRDTELNDVPSRFSVERSPSAVPQVAEVSTHSESEQEATLHASNSLNYNILDTMHIDPLCVDNLWTAPSLLAQAYSNLDGIAWPLLEEDVIGRFTPPVADNLMDSQIPIIQPAIACLWSGLVGRIAPGISLDLSQANNLLRRLLAAEAANRNPLFSALVFFSQSVQSNWTPMHDLPADSAEMATAAGKMEQDTISHIRQFTGDNSRVPREKSQILDLLSTLVALCSSYIAREDCESLNTYLECALSTIRNGFSTELALNETFLFLVHWLGYIHTVAMLGEKSYDITAPDYLSIASEQTAYPVDRIKVFFQDVDSFLGISQTAGELLYRLGRLLRSTTKETSRTHSAELDVEKASLQTRMHLILRRLERFKHEGGVLNDLDNYNEALVYVCLLIFLTRVNEESVQSGVVRSAVDHALESCAAVQESAPVAKLMLLPLFTAGIYTTSLVHREFIRKRLQMLQSGYCIVNVKRTSEILEERWLLTRFPESLFSHQASVCHLF